MAGAGAGARSSRAGGGKRGAASSSAAAASACVYYATTALLVALCVAGAYFLTSTSSADGDAATVTAYRHTTRSSFAYELTRERAAPRGEEASEARDTPAAVKAVGAEEEPRPDRSAGAALGDPHARPDEERVSDEAAAGVEEEHEAAAVAMEDVKAEDGGGHVAAGDDEAASARGGEVEEEKERETAVLEESSREQREQEQEQEPQLEMPHERPRGAAAAVEEKNLDGGIEEESNAGQRQREAEQSALEEQQAAAGSQLRREAQEDPQADDGADEGTEEERGREQSQGEEEARSSSVSGSSGDADSGEAVSESEHTGTGRADGNASQDDGRSVEVEDSLAAEGRTEEQKAWATQADESHRETDRRDEGGDIDGNGAENAGGEEREWRVCNVKAGADYIPCLDNEKAIKKLRPENFRRYEHRERHCPDEGPTCLVALPSGYRRPIEWPKSRDRVWYSNVPHTKLVEVKGHQNWVKVSGQYLTFPGGGTQFIHGALHYIDFLQQVPTASMPWWRSPPRTEPRPAPRRVLRLVRHAGVPEANGGRRDLERHLASIKKDRLNGVGVAFYRKPTSNECYESRRRQQPPMCADDDDADAAWYVRLNPCVHRVPTAPSERGARWPSEWPRRVRLPPYWLNGSQAGVYGRPAPEDFAVDYDHWRRVVDGSYLNGLGIDWSRVRNVMDMRAAYGGFAAALWEKKIWVMNVVNVDAPDTLPVIFERGLLGIYHDWCESFSTYPRSYDLLHADHLFSKIKDRCAVLPVVVEVDRIVRPGGSIVVRDEAGAVGEVEKLLRSLHWDVRLTFSKNDEGVMYAEKSGWRPELVEEPS
ncbi:putative methyltransferase PMT27 [Zea mays]|uniref:Putative methyltransferase PMT27 n=1 Tax=Zea mays TaxID=4577 RepID=A0A1D6LN32_MAIZE|nr:putative methyltransferase PMT27 [Zea mays]